MIKILYDFDIDKINNSRFFDENGQIGRLTESYTSDLLKNHDSIFAFQYIGGGYDSVCFIENVDHKFYIVEPANGLIVAHDLIKGLVEFEEKRTNENSQFEFSFGSMMDETFFRPHRNDDEFLLIGKIQSYSNVSNNVVILKYPKSSHEWKCQYIDFVPELIRFGERMIHLYNRLLPDFKEYTLYPKLKKMLLDDNILRRNYSHLMDVDNLGKSFFDHIK